MNIIILGPQGSGKGTQAIRIAEKYGLHHISTGDIFRENIKNKTDLGKEIEEIMQSGNLVPDDITNQVIKERLEKTKNGFILDGYPRNIEQAKFLDKIAKIDFVIDLELSEEEAINRIASRRLCSKCGESYNVISIKPKVKGICDKCEGKLLQREDDKPEAIKKRLKIYNEQTTPLKDYYRNEGLLIEIDATQSIDEVFKSIINEIDNTG
ncbi:MAG: adenylate kinase [Candidatus Woesearchaeota archaeon]